MPKALKKKYLIPALIVSVLAVILGFGLSSWASHSGDLAYLEVDAPDAQALEYVVLRQPGMACNADTFIGAEVVSFDGRIEAEIVEDEEAVGLCVRADYNYGNYLYEKYGDDWSFIRITAEGKPADPDALQGGIGLRVSIGPGAPYGVASIPGEYVSLEHQSMPCDATTFVNGDATAVSNNQLISLDYGVPLVAGGNDGSTPILCFRADYGFGNYVYAVHGIDENILFSGGRAKSPDPDEIVFADLTAWASGAERLHLFSFTYPGKSCGPRVFDIDAQFIVFSPPGHPELLVETEELEAAEALCFRADYGEGRYAYRKFGGRKIEIRPHYRLTLTIEKKAGQLLIRSNTDVSSWQLARGDYRGFFYGSSFSFGGHRLFDSCSSHVASFVPSVDLPETSESGVKEWVIDIREEDYGRKYCIKAEDSHGSVAYLASDVLDSDLSLEVIQDGEMLKASVNLPEEVADWQAVKTSGECSHFSFIARANVKEESSFELTRRDHNRYYCFRAKDRHGGYALRRSPLVNMAINPEIISVEQQGGIVLAEASNLLNKQLFFLDQWRVAKVDRPACDEKAISEGVSRPRVIEGFWASQVTFLEANDVGGYICFAIDYRGGLSRYRLSEQITAFESRQASEDQVADIRQYGRHMVARADRPAFWYAFPVQDEADCSQHALSRFFGGAGEPRALNYHYRPLGEEDNGAFICFEVRFTESNQEKSYVVSPAIESVVNQRRVFREYPYEVPETLDSGQDLADFLRPYLTDKGLEILDGLSGISLYSSPVDFSNACGVAAGCYHGWSKSIHMPLPAGYNDSPTDRKKDTFRPLLETFIHEFMHAIDYQDPDIAGLSSRTLNCFDSSKPTGGFDTGIEDAGVLSYVQCLDESYPLFRQLRELYDDLPADLELDHGLSDYRHLTNINGRWGNSQQGSHSRLWHKWYTELYAEAVFIRHLPQGLEEHYGQYFKDRLSIVEIYESRF